MRIEQRSAALLLICSFALASCSGGSGGGSSSAVSANDSGMFAAAPCPADDTNPLAGIEGWAPGAGQASKMADNAQSNIGGFAAGMGGAAPETPTPSPTGVGGCKSFTPFLNERFAKLADLRKQFPTTTYDVASAASTFTTPDAAFSFVRDIVHTDAYIGSMRGARGTLISKAGSPLDKAQLLHDLLAAQSIPSRYVHTTLTGAEANALAAITQTPARIDPKAVIAKPAARKAMDAGIASAATQAATVSSIIATKGLAIASPGYNATASLVDHWWLQAQIDGAWVDLDPSQPAAKRGTHLGGAPIGDPIDAIPATAQQRIAVRLLADTGTGAPQVLAHAEAAASDAIEAPIIVRMTGAGDGDIPAQTSFVPSVSIGDAGGDGDAFSPDAAGASLLVLYLDVELDVPGAPPIVHRQVVLDRRGADGKVLDASWTPAKTAYAMTFTYAGLESTGDSDPVYDAGVSIDSLLRGALAADYAALHPGIEGFPPGVDSTYPYEAHRFFQYDGGIRGALQQKNTALAFTFTHPMVALLEQTFDLRGGDLKFVQSFDIVDNGLAATAPMANLERGIMDTSVEASLISGPGTHLDTGAVFAAAKAAGTPNAVITQNAIASAPVSAHDALTAGLTGAMLAIAPATAPSIDGAPAYGWLEVDTSTGNAVGRMRSGAGQAMTERSILEQFVEKYSDIKGIGRCINCFFSGMASAASGDKHHGEKFASCLADALCQYVADSALDFMLIHGFEWEGTAMDLVTGPYSDIAGEVIGGGPTGAICNGIGTNNPYSRPIIG